MIKKIAFTLILAIAFTGLSMAQGLKIGYVNIELVLVYMPESQSMNQTLQTFQKKLSEKLQTKQQYAQTKFGEYQNEVDKMDEETRTAKETELMKLDEEIKKESADAEQKLMTKRQELMNPLLEKLDKAIKDMAKAEGYDYIINSIDGNGVSIVLYGPEEHDLTEKLMTSLGIKIPAKD